MAAVSVDLPGWGGVRPPSNSPRHSRLHTQVRFLIRPATLLGSQKKCELSIHLHQAMLVAP